MSSNVRRLIASDLYRYTESLGVGSFLRYFLLVPGFKYTVALRLRRWARDGGFPASLFGPLFALIHYRWSLKYGISIPVTAEVGPGLFMGHSGGIFVSDQAVIGRDCNLSQGVTIGVANRGLRAGHATIGDRVYIGPGAKIVGAVTVGADAAIGANAVVTKDVPAWAVVGGVPARVISNEGSPGYVARTGYGQAPPRA